MQYIFIVIDNLHKCKFQFSVEWLTRLIILSVIFLCRATAFCSSRVSVILPFVVAVVAQFSQK